MTGRPDLTSPFVDEKIDRLCDRFEVVLKSGSAANVREFLGQIDSSHRQMLFRELLLVQLAYVPQDQQAPLLETYVKQMPEYSSVTLALLASLSDSGSPDNRAGSINCPHCQASIVLTQPPHASPSAEDQQPSPRGRHESTIAHYRLIDELGHGAFGAVYRAFDERLQRIVALKLRRPDATRDDAYTERFRREARNIAQLDHPGIVRLFESSHNAEYEYLAMEYVPGRPLSDLLAQRSFGKREAVQLVADVAGALDHAHQRGVIHRDLKPSNILVGRDGRPKITDFGLARRDAECVTVTADGKLLGTPGYMSPEQAHGGAHHADRRSDIYSLGVVFFELLTGDLPFRGSPAVLVHRVLHEEPPVPSTMPGVSDKDLDAICLTCLEKTPRLRYQSAHDLQEELKRWLNGQPIHTRPLGAVRRAVRWASRRPLTVALLMTLVLVAVSFPSFLFWHWRSVHAANERLLSAYIGSLLVADARSTAAIVDSIKPFAPDIQPKLHERLSDESLTPNERARLSVLLEDLSVGEMELLKWAALEASVHELPLFSQTLARHLSPSISFLKQTIQDSRRTQDERLRAACLLAELDANDDQWSRESASLADILLGADLQDADQWLALLKPVQHHLEAPLYEAFHAAASTERRNSAAWALASFSAAELHQMTHLLLSADEDQFVIVLDRASRSLEQGLLEKPNLRRTLQRSPQGNWSHEANRALALGSLVQSQLLWPRLEHQDDPTIRTELIHRLSSVFSADVLIKRLSKTESTDEAQALILALARVPPHHTTESQRSQLLELVLHRCRPDGDSGIRAAAEWFFSRHRALGRRTMEDELAAGGTWYTSSGGQTMIRIEPTDRSQTKSAHGRPKPFAISAHEITVAQYRQFDASYGASDQLPDEPAVGLTPWEAAQFCNWLSGKDGIPESQWCYPSERVGRPGAVVPHPDYLERTGYRFPTVGEWMFACQAGADTGYSFGDNLDRLKEYAWYRANSSDSVQPIGQLLPNRLGLFDMLGNAMELCHVTRPDQIQDYDKAFSVYLGGAFRSDAKGVGGKFPFLTLQFRSPMCGFRIARSYELSSFREPGL